MSIASRLVAAAGTRRLLWLDHCAYSARLLAGGRAPWLDVAACAAWLRQAQGLLRSDVLALPLAEVAAARVAHDAALRGVMAGRARRAHGPLKEALADAPLRAHAVALVTALRVALPGVLLVLILPSHYDWPARMLALSEVSPAPEVDEDAADAAAACMADFLRVFAAVGVDAVLLREPRTLDAAQVAQWLELAQPVVNVAGHYGWDWGLQLPEAVELHGPSMPGFTIAPAPCGRGPTGVPVSASFWQGDTAPAALPGSFDVAEIPVDAHPETVLSQLALLRERPATW